MVVALQAAFDAAAGHRRPEPADLSHYAPSEGVREVKYGLPSEVRFCRKCVISNQRPNSAVEFKHTKESRKVTIAFDADGVCDACRAAEEKYKTIDWQERESRLIALCDRFRSRNGSYDCLVPGSGGKDSFYASHVLKYKYGMHPLTVTWAPHVYTDWGWKNFQAWIQAGFDNYLCTPNGRVHRLLTRLAVENLFHPFQPFILGQKQLAPKMSVLFNLPLVFYGENEAEYGNPIQDAGDAKRNWEYFSSRDESEIFLGGEPLSALRSDYGLQQADFEPYLPADPAKLAETRTEVHYLGYYLKWHPQSCYYYAVEHGGFQASPERTPGTYSKYNSIDDRIDDFHYYTTWIKFGIGRATYDAAQEIRSGDITRDEGVALVRRFDGEFPERFADEIFRYLSIPAEEFPQASFNFEQPTMDRAYFDQLTEPFSFAAPLGRDEQRVEVTRNRLWLTSMRTIRLIARLDIKAPNLIKGVHLEGLRVVGDPNVHARRYFAQDADELIYMDIVASLYDRNSLTEIVESATYDVFVPMTVGGGVRSVEDARKLLASGADKVAVNTAAIKKPALITEIARRFGSQAMVLSIEAKRRGAGRWEAYTDNGREHTGLDVLAWAKCGAELGAGEILLTSIDQEGTRKGFDIPLVKAVTDAVAIPVIASGGMGSVQHVVDVVTHGGADAIAIADALHYNRTTLPALRAALLSAGLPLRIPSHEAA